jgi:nucleotide-binding universal stress UspA family protein
LRAGRSLRRKEVVKMRILLAVDGSAPAERAAALIASVSWAEDDRLRILSVAPARGEVFGAVWGAPIPPNADDVEATVIEGHRAAIARAEAEIRATRGDLETDSIVLRGRPASVIVDQARSSGVDLIVVGHRGLGAWQSRLLGSVSAEVVDQAPCPVLVVRDDQIGPVVLADDGSLDARAAGDVVAGWPLFRGLPVTVVGVVHDTAPSAAGVAPLMLEEEMTRYASVVQAERRMRTSGCDATVERLRAEGIDAVAEIRQGDPAHEIVSAAESARAGLVVLGTRGLTGLRRLLIGSVARNVLLSAPCSVLVVRDGSVAGHFRPDGGRETREVVSAFG